MNIYEMEILSILAKNDFVNQRKLSQISGYSIGVVNKSLKNLANCGYIDESIALTSKAFDELRKTAPKNAIILAAGFGMRMVPINTETPKALIEVKGEILIERLIRQIREAGIKNIYVVTGFLKEQFEYLIDDYDVELIVNSQYATKNNLHSLRLAADKIDNSYIVPGDLWCAVNPFKVNETYSWYMVSESVNYASNVRVNRKKELVRTTEGGNTMIGISYLTGIQAETVKNKLISLDMDRHFDNSFWEEALFDDNRMIVQAKQVGRDDVVEINTYEQLREVDEDSNHLKSDAIEIIEETLNVSTSDITDIHILTKGMTNRSFIFSCNGKKYIMRIPGEGTDQLINRQDEATVYEAIKGKNICDDVIYINPQNGYKITEFLRDSRVCDAENVEDLVACMKKLRDFHEMNLKVDHEFDIFAQIEFYESLWEGAPSVYRDYKKTKKNVLSLKKYIDSHATHKCLTHVDAVPDNFLINKDGDIRLIDWEYAGMQDPHVDIAMFCIYSLYDRNSVDRLIDIYFENKCDKETRLKIYCYIAVCGLLWSNWCEFKRNLGVEFGEYSLRQYRYAKDYYKLVSGEFQNKEK